MGHRRVGWELQHHDNILLHLLRKHQRALQEKILFRPPGRTTPCREERGKGPRYGAADEGQDKRRVKRPVLAREKREGEGGKRRTERKLGSLSRIAVSSN